MEHKESIISRLFGFGRRRAATPQPGDAVDAPPESIAAGGATATAPETGFAKTEAAEEAQAAHGEEEADEPRITVPEQVIRIKPGRPKSKDELVGSIRDSFKELTHLLGSVSDRLDRQDSRVGDLTEQLRELPEYLRTLPQLQAEQNRVIAAISERMAEGNDLARRTADSIARLPEAQEEQTRAMHAICARLAEGTGTVQRAIERIPEEIRERVQAQEEAIRDVARAQEQTAKVLHAGHNKSLQLFHRATQKTLETVQSAQRDQQEQMQSILDASVANMKRMFVLAAAFAGAAIVALASLFLLR